MRNYLAKYGFSDLFSVIICVFCLLIITPCTIPWLDEIGTADTPINYVLYGQWSSDVWQYTYNPLHAFLLIGWISIFGISHTAVISLNFILTLVATLWLTRILYRRKLVTHYILQMAVVAFCWITVAFELGRIDMLLFVLTIGCADNLIPEDGRPFCRWRIAIYAFLLMLAGIYSIPILLAGMATLYIYYWRDTDIRRGILCQSIICLLSMIAAFLLVCAFYYRLGQLQTFISTYFFFSETASGTLFENSFIAKIQRAYTRSSQPLIVAAFCFILAIFRRKKGEIASSIFCLLIPSFLVLAGRYHSFYGWIFSAPAIALAATIVQRIERSRFYPWFLVSVILFITPKYDYYHKNSTNRYPKLQECERFIIDNQVLLQSSDDIAISDPFYYYPLVRLGKHIRYPKNENAVNINSPFPPNGLAITRNEKQYEEFLDLLHQKGVFTSDILVCNGEANIIRYSLMQNEYTE